MPKKKAKPRQRKDLNEPRAATAQYDGEIDESQLRPLTESERKRWERVKRKRGRPPFVVPPLGG